MNRNSTNIVFLFLFTLVGSACSPSVVETPGSDAVTPRNALENYLANDAVTFKWDLIATDSDSGVEVADLMLTSQEWRGITWKHHLTVMVPDNLEFHDALLFITGGRLENQEPEPADPDDDLRKGLLQVCLKNRAVVAILRQVPNQPLFNGLYEDALISYTLHQFQETGDFSWPLLFPMTMSAHRAMDAVQEFCRADKHLEVSGFLVSGASKRGWTSWLTGASDSRVKAICPMVFDVLNMPVQMDYQVEAWGAYSEEIQDYVNLGITRNLSTPDGTKLADMIDPYSYREALTQPKLILLGTNDPYWPVDAARNYLDAVPGGNFLHYVPNAGHDLNGGEEALRVLSSFFSWTLRGSELPAFSSSIAVKESKAEIAVDARDGRGPVSARLWTAASADRDFRDEEWISTQLVCRGNPEVQASVSLPLLGFRAFYIQMEFPGPEGNAFSACTRVFVMDSNQVF